MYGIIDLSSSSSSATTPSHSGLERSDYSELVPHTDMIIKGAWGRRQTGNRDVVLRLALRDAELSEGSVVHSLAAREMIRDLEEGEGC